MKFILVLLGLLIAGCGDDVRIVNSPSKCKKKPCKKAEVALAQDTWYRTNNEANPPFTETFHVFSVVLSTNIYPADFNPQTYLLEWEGSNPYAILYGKDAQHGAFFSEEPPGANHLHHIDPVAVNNHLKARDLFYHQQ